MQRLTCADIEVVALTRVVKGSLVHVECVECKHLYRDLRIPSIETQDKQALLGWRALCLLHTSSQLVLSLPSHSHIAGCEIFANNQVRGGCRYRTGHAGSLNEMGGPMLSSRDQSGL